MTDLPVRWGMGDFKKWEFLVMGGMILKWEVGNLIQIMFLSIQVKIH